MHVRKILHKLGQPNLTFTWEEKYTKRKQNCKSNFISSEMLSIDNSFNYVMYKHMPMVSLKPAYYTLLPTPCSNCKITNMAIILLPLRPEKLSSVDLMYLYVQCELSSLKDLIRPTLATRITVPKQ